MGHNLVLEQVALVSAVCLAEIQAAPRSAQRHLGLQWPHSPVSAGRLRLGEPSSVSAVKNANATATVTSR